MNPLLEQSLDNLKERAEKLSKAVQVVETLKNQVFPTGATVNVDSDRYRGPGTVVIDNQCPPHLLPVLLGNGNTWWYPVEDCEVKP